jgi:hypothetical protein
MILDAAARHAGRERRRHLVAAERRLQVRRPDHHAPRAGESKNVPSVRLLRAISVPYAHEFLGKFGFDLAAIRSQPDTMALGTGAVTPLQMAGAYAVFANGGYQVQPYLIAKIEDADGKVIAEAKPPARQEAQRVLDARNAFITDSMLRDVTRYGTGAAATKRAGPHRHRRQDRHHQRRRRRLVRRLRRQRGGGGLDGLRRSASLGGREFGATLALPIWIDYMQVALAKRRRKSVPQPEGVVRENDDWVYAEFAENRCTDGHEPGRVQLDRHQLGRHEWRLVPGRDLVRLGRRQLQRQQRDRHLGLGHHGHVGQWRVRYVQLGHQRQYRHLGPRRLGHFRHRLLGHHQQFRYLGHRHPLKSAS